MNTLAPRRFGIELEVSRRFVNVAYHDRKKSEAWNELINGVHMLGRDRRISHGWKVKTDTSCGGEIVSPPMYAPEGLREIGVVCDFAKKAAKKWQRPVVDGECGS